MPRRLRSDVVRHLIAMTVVILISVGGAQLAVHGNEPRTNVATRTAFSLGAMGLYGPLYLALTALWLRGVRGPRLRVALRTEARASRRWKWVLAGTGPRTWAISVSVLSMLAVLVLTVVGRGRTTVWVSAAGIVCVAGCWVLLLAVFAYEYARRWARSDAFAFPGSDGERSFEDFVYLAVQVSTTFSTSDVQVMDSETRGTVTVHTLAAWAFSTVIIALVVALALPTG